MRRLAPERAIQDCLGRIAASPRVAINAAYPGDRAIQAVRRTKIAFAKRTDIVPGLQLPRIRPPSGREPRWAEPGPLDGYAVWPLNSMEVKLTRHGIEALRQGMAFRCELAAWWPCLAAARTRIPRPPPAPPWTDAMAESVRPALAPALALIEGRPPLRLVDELDMDLDGDGTTEHLYNVAISEFTQQVMDGGILEVELPDDLYFFFVRKGGEGAVLAVLDLEGDGHPELWIETPYYEGTTWSVVRFDGTNFRVVASFTD